MNYLVCRLITLQHEELPAQRVEANGAAQAKLVGATQAGGYWNEETIAIPLESPVQRETRIAQVVAEYRARFKAQ